MKAIKFIITFLLLMIVGIFISYANIKDDNWTDNFIETFEETDANFKFYNIKVNCIVDDNLSKEKVKDMCIDVARTLNMDEDKIKWNIKEDKNHAKIYGIINNDIYNLSFIATKKIIKNII